ncbi:phage holin family protein [Halomonas sp. H5]|uniref:phage holin family protein n=1 Tax=Halomonas sp. H5 TaxID=3423910 RepID=UPI003D36BCBC
MSVFTDIAILAATISLLRILTFQRRGSRYRRGISFLAWLLACANVVLIFKLPGLALPEPASIGLAIALVIVAALLLRARGNVAHVFPLRRL